MNKDDQKRAANMIRNLVSRMIKNSYVNLESLEKYGLFWEENEEVGKSKKRKIMIFLGGGNSWILNLLCIIY